MKYSQVSLTELKTSHDCIKAMDDIDNDWRNYVGGWNRWISGYETVLLKSAKAKRDAICKRLDRLEY